MNNIKKVEVDGLLKSLNLNPVVRKIELNQCSHEASTAEDEEVKIVPIIDQIDIEPTIDIIEIVSKLSQFKLETINRNIKLINIEE